MSSASTIQASEAAIASSDTTPATVAASTPDAPAASSEESNLANASGDESIPASNELENWGSIHSVNYFAAASFYPFLLNGKLKELEDSFPPLQGLLTPKIVHIISSDANVPFDSDEHFMDSLMTFFHVKKHALQLTETLRVFSLHNHLPSVHHAQHADPEYMRKAGMTLNEMLVYIVFLIQRKLEAHDKAKKLKPRLVRLCDHLGLSKKEMFAFTHISFMNSDVFSFESRETVVLENFLIQLSKFCSMSVKECLQFLDSSRKHVKEGIMNPTEDYPTRYPPTLPIYVLPALYSLPMSTEDTLKLDGTSLAEVLEEEKRHDAAAKAEAAGIPLVPYVDSKLPKDSHLHLGAKTHPTDSGTSLLLGSVSSPMEDEKDLYDLLREQVQLEKEEIVAIKKNKKKKKWVVLSSTSEGADDATTSSVTPGSEEGQDGEEEDLEDEDEETVEEEINKDELKPYTTNLQYLSDHFDWISYRCRVSGMERELSDDNYNKDVKAEQQLRELRAKEKMQRALCQKRMELTVANGPWLPRLEKLGRILELDDFEKLVLWTLAGNKLSNKIAPEMGRWNSRSTHVSNFAVGQLLNVFCSNFEDEVNKRHYFYKNSRLIKEGIIRLSESVVSSELMNTDVEIDRRMLDFIAGLETELSEMVEGSHLYTPSIRLDQVIMPEEQKQMIVETVTSFEKFKKYRKKLGFDEIIAGAGILLLFFGKSGTGKTMMANALANHLGKRILLINFPSLGSQADQVIKFIFREAKLTDSILFFDECETLFKSRDISCGGSINLLLTEIEMHSGLIIMATNRAYDLDEAMHRRITMAIEFASPTIFLREKIWQAHVPQMGIFEKNIDWHYIAVKYELSGGFIRSAMLSALSIAVARAEKENHEVLITQADLEKGAVLQLRGRLNMVDFDRRVVPTRGLDDIVLSKDTRQRMQDIINFEKARQVLMSEWGFSEAMCRDQGTTCLFHGPPGVGKTIACEAIGLETGKPLKVVNYSELISKFVGDSSRNLEALFKEAKLLDCIIVFDEAEGLFGSRSEQSRNSTDRYANVDTGVLLYHMERFPGVVILCTNIVGAIDPAFFRRFRFVVEFKNPDAPLRERLFRDHIPAQVPISSDVNLALLSTKYPFAGGNIKNVCFKACSRAALRPKEQRRVTMADLEEYCKEEELAAGMKSRPAEIYS